MKIRFRNSVLFGLGVILGIHSFLFHKIFSLWVVLCFALIFLNFIERNDNEKEHQFVPERRQEQIPITRFISNPDERKSFAELSKKAQKAYSAVNAQLALNASKNKWHKFRRFNADYST